MNIIVLVFSFVLIFPFTYLILSLFKNYGFRKRYSEIKTIKLLSIILIVSIIPSAYLSYKTVYPSDSELIRTFENSYGLEFPKSAKIVSKKSNSGFRNSYMFFTATIEKNEELKKLKQSLLKRKFKISNQHSYTRKSDTIFTLTKGNTYNIQFIKNTNNIFFEEIN